jgi:glycosyltransferase involved in cell wall biosynthesis
MRILSVVESFAHGGAETVLVDLALGLRQHEHRVIHFSRANAIAAHGPFLDALAAGGVPCADVHWGDLNSAGTRRHALGAFEPDVVLFHWWGKDPWLPWIREAARRLGRRPAFVVVLHHAERLAAPGYDHYVLVSPSQLPQVQHVPPARISIVPNGVDLARFARTVRPRPAAGGPFVIGRLSGLRAGKIPPDWIRIAASFPVPDAHFVIAGEGALRRVLEQDVRALGLERRFTLPGYVSREAVPGLLASFDVFCYVTSTAVECHPLVLLEALAAGVPIVAEARGGIPDVVVDGVNGLLAESPADVGHHLRALRDDPALHARLAAGATRTAPRFRLGRQLEAYERLIGAVGSAGPASVAVAGREARRA